eukprot:CAMPEP_0184132316 /NCGR_PEP_ID=MMETSP0974-20121125/28561_1 /TAXON_ID=483370 /ORGANISM="non described non described, Strain CCMP2097" /LENGTH=52 /DNA_ID=CAMNT_0026435823 /DNA_START=96 /DNA_END=251 /DNA_ORIENTATION=-
MASASPQATKSLFSATDLLPECRSPSGLPACRSPTGLPEWRSPAALGLGGRA